MVEQEIYILASFTVNDLHLLMLFVICMLIYIEICYDVRCDCNQCQQGVTKLAQVVRSSVTRSSAIANGPRDALCQFKILSAVQKYI